MAAAYSVDGSIGIKGLHVVSPLKRRGSRNVVGSSAPAIHSRDRSPTLDSDEEQIARLHRNTQPGHSPKTGYQATAKANIHRPASDKYGETLR